MSKFAFGTVDSFGNCTLLFTLCNLWFQGLSCNCAHHHRLIAWLPRQPHSRYSLTHIHAPEWGVEPAKSPQAFSVDYTIAFSKLKTEVEDKNQPLSDGWGGVKKNNWMKSSQKKTKTKKKNHIFFIESTANKWEVANGNESLSHEEWEMSYLSWVSNTVRFPKVSSQVCLSWFGE